VQLTDCERQELAGIGAQHVRWRLTLRPWPLDCAEGSAPTR
jgi:hypothetical protein